jgi:3-hydroxybutyryl-CoA dehydratase
MNGLHGYYFEDIAVGMTAVYSKTITEADILMFSGVSGDTNPLHLDQTFAESTIFKSRIAHGMLSASFLSTIFGTKLPGPGGVYLSQNLRFKAPVRVGDTVLARATVKELIPEKRRALFDCVCTVGETVVIEGEAVIMIPARPANHGIAAE